MRRFRFRLDRVLRYRRQIQEARQREFSEAQARVVAQERYIGQLREERASEQEAFRRTRLDAGTRRAVQLRRAYLAGLELRLASARKDLAELAREAEVRREALVRARRDVRALEILREKRLAEHRRAEEIEEQKAIDEMASKPRALPVAERPAVGPPAGAARARQGKGGVGHVA